MSATTASPVETLDEFRLRCRAFLDTHAGGLKINDLEDPSG